MNRKNRLGLFLPLMLLIAACTDATEPSTEAPPETTASTSPATTNPSTTTTSGDSAPTLLRPWEGPTASGVQISLIAPDDWDIQDGFIITGDEQDGTFMRVGAGIIGNVFADRCQWSTTRLDPPLGPTVEDLTTAFSTIWGSGATTPADVTVDDFDGKYMALTVPTDVDFADCNEQHFAGWAEAGSPDSAGPSRVYQGPGQILEHWILDVDGVRLVIEASHFPQLSTEGLAELQGIIDSIQIVTE